jgi:hypothetical protein
MALVFILNSIIKGSKNFGLCFFKKFPTRQRTKHANPKALKELLVLAEAQMSGFNAAIQGSLLSVGSMTLPLTVRKTLTLYNHSQEEEDII